MSRIGVILSRIASEFKENRRYARHIFFAELLNILKPFELRAPSTMDCHAGRTAPHPVLLIL